MDNELFELCKEVYEKTGWTDTGRWFNQVRDLTNKYGWVESHREGGYERFPCYTSDYLLEKLPHFVKTNDKRFKTGSNLHIVDQTVPTQEGGLHVVYAALYKTTHGTLQIGGKYMLEHADTPLKALLKLCLALKEAGEL